MSGYGQQPPVPSAPPAPQQSYPPQQYPPQQPYPQPPYQHQPYPQQPYPPQPYPQQPVCIKTSPFFLVNFPMSFVLKRPLKS
nr:uncharacterized protein LOC128688883 [Cherax quadricarinatus]